MARRAVALLLLVAAACASGGPAVPPAHSCKQLGLSCTAKRLPNRTLHGEEVDGALRSVDGFDLTGILTFDQALERGWYEFHPDSKTIQVVLGGADATRWHWGTGRHLYFAVEYTDVCRPTSVTAGAPTPVPPCVRGDESVVLDAHTGRFIGAGG